MTHSLAPIGLAAILLGSAASAQVVTLSTTNPGGLGHSIGSAVARVVSDNSDVSMIVVPSGGATLQAVSSGEAECAVSNGHALSFYVNGTGIYEDQGAHPDMRMVAAVLPSLVAMYVSADSGIEALPDLAGLRYPGDLSAQPDISIYYDLYLSWGGLTRDDVEVVPASSIVQAADDFAAGRVDAFAFSLNTAKVLEVESAVGDLRILNVDATDDNLAMLTNRLPGGFFTEIQPGEAPQVTEPTNALSVYILIACTETVPDEVVAQIVASIHDHPDQLSESFGGFSRFEAEDMAPVIGGVSYHPGAQTYYEDLGIFRTD